MPEVVPRLLRGFRDYLPPKMIPRQRMLAAIERTFQRFGFPPLMTPALEHLDILTGKYGAEGDSLLYRFKTLGGRDVGLRYDLTVPLARVIAQYGELTLPFRRYQIAPVWRAEKPGRGRYREFVQCDADIVGSADMSADAELVQLACELLENLGVENYCVRLNNRKVLAGLMHKIGVTSPEAEMGVLRTIDKLPKIGEETMRQLLSAENDLDSGQIDTVGDFLRLTGETGELLKRLEGMFDGGPGRQGAAELKQLFSILDAPGISGTVEIDLSIARGLTYYTGTIYETFLTDLPGYGAVMGGGRYDGLVGTFKGQDIPAVGISLGIDRLLEGLMELKLLEEHTTVARVLVTVFGPETAAYSARVARQLRAAGIECELFPAYARIGKQFRHADRRGQRWVIVAGTEEQSKNEVRVKDLESGEQENVAFGELVEYLRGKQEENDE